MNNSKKFFRGKFFISTVCVVAVIMLFVVVIYSVNFKTADKYNDAPQYVTSVAGALDSGTIDDYEYFKPIAKAEAPVVNSTILMGEKFKKSGNSSTEMMFLWSYQTIFIEDESLVSTAIATFYMCEYAVEQDYSADTTPRYSKKITPFMENYFLATGDADGIDVTGNALWLGRKNSRYAIVNPSNGYLSQIDSEVSNKHYFIDSAMVVRLPKGCKVVTEYSVLYPDDEGEQYA